MIVFINDIKYIPAPIENIENMENALNILFWSSDLDKELTIRDYLKELLLSLWQEQEGFSGKRPFGNSGWTHVVYATLIKNSLINGTIDVDGYIEEFDEKEATDFMLNLIRSL